VAAKQPLSLAEARALFRPAPTPLDAEVRLAVSTLEGRIRKSVACGKEDVRYHFKWPIDVAEIAVQVKDALLVRGFDATYTIGTSSTLFVVRGWA
jgi:hypothetical protein